MRPFLLAVPSLVLVSALVASAATPAGTAAGRHAPASFRSSGPRMVLPFIADDYTRALAQARARKVPLFIEAWAPW
jgi:hypothetical protein